MFTLVINQTHLSLQFTVTIKPVR